MLLHRRIKKVGADKLAEIEDEDAIAPIALQTKNYSLKKRERDERQWTLTADEVAELPPSVSVRNLCT